ncbi:JAB domain-containing protein [Paenibacillus elgii]|uniref:JAB domain-containing protein n=1 Tax=Paenibacillus elgii TaxID=189691 RepID=UPI00255A3407|nr:JAB domain-containing protein [Paenibacillus elgii]
MYFSIVFIFNIWLTFVFNNKLYFVGDTTPSRENVELTERVKNAGEILGIELLDHIIVADGRHFSLRENGLM